MTANTIYNQDCLTGLAYLPDKSVDCCVTSPPYFGLRDYGNDQQIGMEETPEQFIEKLVAVFREVRRVLKPAGTCWVNIGDSYANDGKWGGHSGGKHARLLHGSPIGRNKRYTGLKPKDLIGIPWMLAFALRADGWYLRQECIWAKPNPMPESVTDRCTKSHESIFLLSKSQRYYFDQEAIKEPVTASTIARLSQDLESQKGSDRVPGKTNGTMKAVGSRTARDNFRREDSKQAEVMPGQTMGTHRPDRADSEYDLATRNKRSVWTVSTKPFSDYVTTSHWQRVAADAASGGTKRITSSGCPVHGLLGRQGSSLFCDGHEADGSIHKGYIDDCLAPARPLDSLSIVQKYASDFGLHNWDSDRQQYVFSAIRHSTGNHKTGLDPETSRPYTSFAQTRAHIERILEVRETSGSAGRMLVSNTLPDEMDDLLWGQIHSHNANSSSSDGECTCAIYKKIAKKTDHFATYPPELIVPCIKAGCPAAGIVLDPFMGAGTTALVARKLGRKYVGFELNAEYVKIAERRLRNELGPLTALFT